jgi:hypothetical protein
MPAIDTIDFEREFEALVAELRALPSAAPDHVREHVRALGEPELPPRLWDRLVTFPWRRSLLVLAPVCALGLVSAALVHGLVNSGPKREAVATVHQGSSGTEVHGKSTWGQAPAPAAGALDSVLPAPSPGRYQDYEAWMTLRVKDLQALTDRTNEAMQVVRAAGGYVASVQQSTAAGSPGQADLVLRVPIARVENVLVQLSNLGTVIDRHLSIRDLEQVVKQQRARILQLKLFIARAAEQLRGTLPADVRLRLQLQLAQARSDLSQLTGANQATLRQASLSRVSLTLTTQKAVGAAKKSGSGRAERAARDAASFLAAAGGVLLFLLIVLSPVLVLAAAVIWGVRAYRRREERRLLAST